MALRPPSLEPLRSARVVLPLVDPLDDDDDPKQLSECDDVTEPIEANRPFAWHGADYIAYCKPWAPEFVPPETEESPA
jgi:hypothetical protein